MGVVNCCAPKNDVMMVDSQLSRRNFPGNIKTHSILKDYTIDRQLGLGSYGEVRLGIHKKTQTKVAIKKLTVDGKYQVKTTNNEILTHI